MSIHSIPVDLTNPGQVLACMGLMEVIDVLYGDVEGRFNWDSQSIFEIRSNSNNPIKEVVDFVLDCSIKAISPSHITKDKFGIDTVFETNISPSIELKSSVFPILLEGFKGKIILITHWGESGDAGLDNLKFWGGAAGYSAAARMRDLQNSLASVPECERSSFYVNPFAVSARLSNGFRLEMRRDYSAIDLGFSPNDHKDIDVIGYPLVELLAVIGLENSRPFRINRFEYKYGVWKDFLPPILARAILGGENMVFTVRNFTMKLATVNKGGDRAILFSREG